MERYGAACSVSLSVDVPLPPPHFSVDILHCLHSLLLEEGNISAKAIATGSVTTVDVDTPLLGLGSGSSTSTHSRRSIVSPVTRKATGIFQRRKITTHRTVLAKGDDLTNEPESTDVSGESSMVASDGAESKGIQQPACKTTNLTGLRAQYTPAQTHPLAKVLSPRRCRA